MIQMISTDRVDTLLTNRNREFGQLGGRIELAAPTSAAPAQRSPQPGVVVSLSANALSIATLLREPMSSSASAVSNFDSFLNELDSELKSQGSKAASLAELPDTYDPARTTLAKQAANYLLSAYYGAQPLYADANSDNPLAGLDRLSLSKMAFNDSGAFTSAERFLATLEMTARDIDFSNRSADMMTARRPEQNEMATQIAFVNNRDVQLASAMTEQEKSWRGWTSVNYFATYTDELISKLALDPPDLPEYQNLKANQSTVLAAYTDKNGAASWISLPLKDTEIGDMRLALLTALPATEQASAEPSGNKQKAWISLYLTVGSYQ
jgi:hypothetical protein